MIAFIEGNKMTTIILNCFLLYSKFEIEAVLEGTDSTQMLMQYTVMLEIKSYKLYHSSLLIVGNYWSLYHLLIIIHWKGGYMVNIISPTQNSPNPNLGKLSIVHPAEFPCGFSSMQYFLYFIS